MNNEAFVYIMESRGTYKIGVSNNVDKRAAQLYTACPDIKILWKSQPTIFAYQVETFLHNLYKEKSFGGEWFCDLKISEVIDKAKDRILYLEGKNLENKDDTVQNTENDVNKRVKKLAEDIYQETEEDIKKDIENMRAENKRIWEFTCCILGLEKDCEYMDLIYIAVFEKTAKQLREEYKITKKDNLRDCFSQEELSKVKSVEMVVSGLVNCGWGYGEIKEFIANQSRKLIVA